MSLNEQRREELIEMIEGAFVHFTMNLCSADAHETTRYSMRRALKRPHQRLFFAKFYLFFFLLSSEDADPFEEGENGDWDFEDNEQQQSTSSGDSDTSNPVDNEFSRNSPELLGTTSKRLLTFRLRVLAQIYELLVENRHATKR